MADPVTADPASSDDEAMGRALAVAATVRRSTSPNPWVGCVVEPGGFVGATEPAGGRHAEVVALGAAGRAAAGATVYVTLEPCAHQGRTPPCVDALVAAGVRRVVVGMQDPDPLVRGKGIDALRARGVRVDVGTRTSDVAVQLAPYVKHRTTGRPWVVLKLATTLDGRTAAPDGTSRWITGAEARADVHRLRAESDAVIVGAGTVRSDDPALTVRDGPGTSSEPSSEPLRVVLGRMPPGARAHPAMELTGDPGALLDELGAKGVVQALVEGGATVAGAFHRAGLVDRYVFYVAAALMGGSDGRPVLAGHGVETMADVWRGTIVSVEQLGDAVRIEVAPSSPA